jgi:hypothetical protein
MYEDTRWTEAAAAANERHTWKVTSKALLDTDMYANKDRN